MFFHHLFPDTCRAQLLIICFSLLSDKDCIGVPRKCNFHHRAINGERDLMRVVINRVIKRALRSMIDIGACAAYFIRTITFNIYDLSRCCETQRGINYHIASGSWDTPGCTHQAGWRNAIVVPVIASIIAILATGGKQQRYCYRNIMKCFLNVFIIIVLLILLLKKGQWNMHIKRAWPFKSSSDDLRSSTTYVLQLQRTSPRHWRERRRLVWRTSKKCRSFQKTR